MKIRNTTIFFIEMYTQNVNQNTNIYLPTNKEYSYILYFIFLFSFIFEEIYVYEYF
jgi:hypothetical protein